MSLQEILRGKAEVIDLSDCCKYGNSGRDRGGQETRILYHNVYKSTEARFVLVSPEAGISLPLMASQQLGQVEHLDTDSTWEVVVVTIEAAVLAI